MRPEPWWKRILRRRLYLADAPRWTLEEIVDLAVVEVFAPTQFTKDQRERFASSGGLMEQADTLAVDGEVFLLWWLDVHARPGLPEHLADRKGGRKRRRRGIVRHVAPPVWPWR